MDILRIILQMWLTIISWKYRMFFAVLNGKFRRQNIWRCIGKLLKSLAFVLTLVFQMINSISIALFSAFNWHPPQYAHLPVILNSHGAKLSKRHEDANVDYYK